MRKLLRRNAEDLTGEPHTLLVTELTRTGTNGRQILAAWRAKGKSADVTPSGSGRST